jgi:hypothetical protein
MSLHVQLSPEALQRLHAERRNSTIFSIVIAGLALVLIAVFLGLLLLPSLPKPPDGLIYTTVTPDLPVKPTPPKLPVNTTNKPSAPAPTNAQVLVANTMAPISIPTTETETNIPSLEIGSGDDFGDGDAFKDGTNFDNVPPVMKKRCSPQERTKRLQEAGGTPACEEAVINSLNWLKQTQNTDGSWDKAHPVAMTGLAILAYLGHCETPQSTEYGDTVSRGIGYLVDIGLKNDGKLTNKPENSIQWVYDHGIATYALAEAYTFCKSIGEEIPGLDKVTKKAGEIIMDGQGASGGWVYRFTPTTSGDNSVGYWQIQALKACKHTGLWPDSKFKKPSKYALQWLDKVQSPDGAVGYRENSAKSPGLTGGAVLAFQMWDGDSKNIKKGVSYIHKTTDFKWETASSNLYYHYYNVQAMINHGGQEWDQYNKLFRDELLKNQQADGAWTQTMAHGPVNTHMATCLATLMLEAYYRFLPGTGAK